MNPFPNLLFAASLVLIILAGCQNRHSAENSALIRNWIELLDKHDTVTLASLYGDSARIESPNWEGVKTGADEIKTVYARYFSGTPNLHYVITHLITTDSSAVVEYSSEGTFLHPENGTPAYMQGRTYILQNCTRMTIKDGKIISQKSYFDQVAFLKQVGFFDRH